jgi:H+/gluconate symporter-like permease
MVGVAGIILSLLLLMFLAWRGASVLVVAPVCVLVAVSADGGTPLLASYTQIFMPGVGQFISRFFPLFLLGAIFGSQMQRSGAARRIALVLADRFGSGQAISAVVLTCALLTAGGVSLFVVVFAVFPIADFLFRRAAIPRRLIPAAIALGSFTFTMTALPGSVQLPNLIPMPYFRTTPWAAPIVGVIASLGMLGLGLTWLRYRATAARIAGEGYGGGEEPVGSELAAELPSVPAAFAPVLAVVFANLVLSLWILPRMDVGYLEEVRFGRTSLDRVLGTWSAILSLLTAVSLAGVLYSGSVKRLNQSLTEGAQASLLPVFNTAVEYGYGTTIAALSGFVAIRDWLGTLSAGSPLISEAVAVNVLAGVAGSASGGLSIALESLGAGWMQQGSLSGCDPELLHRVASLSCGGLDSLPHNGAVITLLLICRSTHRESYGDIAVVSVLIPLLVTALVVVYGVS